jgi:glycosyltransferase involved in cell wall biosynthesis
MSELDVLIPTYRRPAALAATLACLSCQTLPQFRVVISDQGDGLEAASAPEVAAVIRLLRARGHPVETHRHLPRRGMAEQRAFLLAQSRAPYACFLDDDVLLEPDLLERLLGAIERERCGFIGSAVIGLSYVDDHRPADERIELWDGPIQPERVEPGGAGWARHRLHDAANLYHLQRRLGIRPDDARCYKVAWVGGCVLYDVAKLRACGGFEFWTDLPAEHVGEDVLAQLRVMARFGGGGLIPSGAYHQELPTTLGDRRTDAPWAMAQR